MITSARLVKALLAEGGAAGDVDKEGYFQVDNSFSKVSSKTEHCLTTTPFLRIIGYCNSILSLLLCQSIDDRPNRIDIKTSSLTISIGSGRPSCTA
jgi:hypothetical protein